MRANGVMGRPAAFAFFFLMNRCVPCATCKALTVVILGAPPLRPRPEIHLAEPARSDNGAWRVRQNSQTASTCPFETSLRRRACAWSKAMAARQVSLCLLRTRAGMHAWGK